MRPVVGDVEAEMLVVGSIQLGGHRKHVTTFEQQISVQISTNTFCLRVSSSTILWVILMSLHTSFLQISIFCQWQMSSLVSKLDKELEKSLDAGLKLDPNIGDCLEISVMRKR